MQLEQSLERLLDMELMFLELLSLEMFLDSDSERAMRNKILSNLNPRFSGEKAGPLRLGMFRCQFIGLPRRSCSEAYVSLLPQCFDMEPDSDSEWEEIPDSSVDCLGLELDSESEWEDYSSWHRKRPEFDRDCDMSMNNNSMDRLFSFKKQKRSGSEWPSFQQQPINFKEPQTTEVIAY